VRVRVNITPCDLARCKSRVASLGDRMRSNRKLTQKRKMMSKKSENIPQNL